MVCNTGSNGQLRQHYKRHHVCVSCGWSSKRTFAVAQLLKPILKTKEHVHVLFSADSVKYAISHSSPPPVLTGANGTLNSTRSIKHGRWALLYDLHLFWVWVGEFIPLWRSPAHAQSVSILTHDWRPAPGHIRGPEREKPDRWAPLHDRWSTWVTTPSVIIDRNCHDALRTRIHQKREVTPLESGHLRRKAWVHLFVHAIYSGAGLYC